MYAHNIKIHRLAEIQTVNDPDARGFSNYEGTKALQLLTERPSFTTRSLSGYDCANLKDLPSSSHSKSFSMRCATSSRIVGIQTTDLRFYASGTP
jgi:hypothetical protein